MLHPPCSSRKGDAQRQVPNPEHLRWFTKDKLILSILLSSMSEDILGQLTQYKTSRAVWDALHTMFSAQNRARTMQLRYQLSHLKKKDMTAADYFQKMKTLADTMASIGNPLQDQEILGYMLAGLGSLYEALVTTVSTRDTPVSLTNFYAYLISAELRIERNTSVGEIQPSGHSATRAPCWNLTRALSQNTTHEHKNGSTQR